MNDLSKKKKLEVLNPNNQTYVNIIYNNTVNYCRIFVRNLTTFTSSTYYENIILSEIKIYLLSGKNIRVHTTVVMLPVERI